MGTTMKDLYPHMLLNKHTVKYEIITHREDGYAPTAQCGDLECAQDLEISFLASVCQYFGIIDNNTLYACPSFR